MNKREKFLALGLSIVLVAGLVWLGVMRLNVWKKNLDSQALDVERTKVEAEELLSQEQLWEARSGWLDKSQKPFGARKDSELALIKFIEESAKSHNVTIKVQPAEPVERTDLIALTMVVEAHAEMENVMRWMHDLQQPATFLAIPALRMLPDAEDTAKVSASLNIQKWFQKNKS